jgi:integrase
MLLLGLNAALYMEDICDLQWGHLDLTAKTLMARRKKKGRCLRVATLWDETVDAIRALCHRGVSPFVFISPRGTRYNKNTKINDFKDYRVKAGVSETVTWSHLRDGAYTAAVTAPGVDEKFARLLAGHKAQGLQDKYVLRNPAMVKPAWDAVYSHYVAAIRAMTTTAAFWESHGVQPPSTQVIGRSQFAR